jgi:vacuolar-type H+-ATPase subunit H
MTQRFVSKEQWLQADNEPARICPRLLDKFDEIYQKIESNKPENIKAERRRIIKEGKDAIEKCKLLGLISSPKDVIKK